VLLLLLGAGAVRWASSGLMRGNTARLRPGFAAATALATAFLVTLAIERAMAGFRWDENAYASIVWTIHLVHALHMVVLAIIGAGVFLLAGREFYSQERRLGIEVLALFWYVVTLAWLPVFAILYLIAW
jgi:cytochrome c oxidase subunit III